MRAPLAVLLGFALLMSTETSRAGRSEPVSARSGLDLAADAAMAWSSDAQLVYVENDEDVSGGGRADRWGYLFFSAKRNSARAYSLRNGEIKLAKDLDFALEAPPVESGWIDSDLALQAADKELGQRYRDEMGGMMTTMLLVRGAFHWKDPDATTWVMVYTADGTPALFVVVDAHSGKVVRSWRG